MATLLLYQPLPFALVVGAPLNVGLTLSMLIAFTVADALLPATSETLPVTDWLAPSVLTVVLPGQPGAARPDASVTGLSTQSKCAVTELLFQPKPLAAGVRDPVMVGAAL